MHLTYIALINFFHTWTTSFALKAYGVTDLPDVPEAHSISDICSHFLEGKEQQKQQERQQEQYPSFQ